ncbi:MAG: hypothetical protein QOJ96_461, partial [Alphaproteobacteria bacterium]|nr:hypothetical protein [Alphaproteobacteria bacterium]
MPKLGVVIFGASKYDNHRELNNPAFALSAQQFLKTISDPKIIPDCTVSSLDLYDEPYRPGETLEKITDFVSRDFDIVIVYYCGHGDVALKAREYRVFLRKSKKNLRATTMLDVNGLINDVEGISTEKTVYFVLDACFSGAAIQEFMDAGGTEALIDRSLSQTITQRGVAIFAATSGSDVALTKKADKLSLFTGAFVRCLNEGIPYKPDVNKLSWLEVRDEIARSTRDRLGPDAPVPKIMSADEKFGDVTRVPFFLNRAYAPSMKSTATAEELYWRSLPDDPPLSVLHDFLTKFPDGIFAALARALADKKISRVTESELQEHLGFYPKTKFKRQIVVRLTTLKRESIQNSTDIAALEQIAAENPELANEASYRIDFIRRELAEDEAWGRVKTSAIKADLEQFLEAYPDGRFSKLARARLMELSATPGRTADERHWIWRFATPPIAIAIVLLGLCVVAVGGLRSYYIANLQIAQEDLDAAGRDVTRLQDFLRRCEATSYCTLAKQARDRLAAVRAATEFVIASGGLDAAGKDIAKLGSFVASCKETSCSVLQEANKRLAAAEAVEAERLRKEADSQELAAVPGDIASLGAFVDKCKRTSCLVLEDANGRLIAAHAAETARLRKEADNYELASVPNDVTSLNDFVDKCKKTSCLVLDDANRRLAVAQAAEATRVRKEADSRELAGVPNDVASLSAFVDKCKRTSCLVLDNANGRLIAAQAAEAMRVRKEADSRELAGVPNDVASLSAFVDKCKRTSCLVLDDANRRLAVAQAAEATRVRKEADSRELAG